MPCPCCRCFCLATGHACIGGALSTPPLLHLPLLPADNTLVDAAPCSIAPNDWPLLDWRYVLVTNSYGRQLQAQYAPLPGHDPFSGAAGRRCTEGALPDCLASSMVVALGLQQRWLLAGWLAGNQSSFCQLVHRLMRRLFCCLLCLACRGCVGDALEGGPRQLHLQSAHQAGVG